VCVWLPVHDDARIMPGCRNGFIEKQIIAVDLVRCTALQLSSGTHQGWLDSSVWYEDVEGRTAGRVLGRRACVGVAVEDSVAQRVLCGRTSRQVDMTLVWASFVYVGETI
jgi:hypothetical protein